MYKGAEFDTYLKHNFTNEYNGILFPQYHYDENEVEERMPMRRSQVPKKPRLPITYAVFLGKVPAACR